MCKYFVPTEFIRYNLFESADVRFKVNMHDSITDFIKIKYEEKI